MAQDNSTQLSPFMVSALLSRQGRSGGGPGAPLVPNFGAEYGSGIEASNLLKQQQIKTTQDAMALKQNQAIQQGVNLLAQTKGQGPIWNQFAQQNPGTAQALVMKQQSDVADHIAQVAKLHGTYLTQTGGSLNAAKALTAPGGLFYGQIPPPTETSQDAFYARYQEESKQTKDAATASGMISSGIRMKALGSEADGQKQIDAGNSMMQALNAQHRAAANASNATANDKNATAPTRQPVAQSVINKNNAEAAESNAKASNGGSTAAQKPFTPNMAQLNQVAAKIKQIYPNMSQSDVYSMATDVASDAGTGMKKDDNWADRLNAAFKKRSAGIEDHFLGSPTYKSGSSTPVQTPATPNIPPGTPSATGPNGTKVYFINGKWGPAPNG